MAVLKIHAVNSDSSPNTETFEYVVKDPATNAPIVDDETGAPCVVIVLRPCSQPEWRRILKRHETTEVNKQTRAMERSTDEVAALQQLHRDYIVSWRGIVGADDKPLVCNDTTKAELPAPIKHQVTVALLGAEVAEAASFSEPAVVS